MASLILNHLLVNYSLKMNQFFVEVWFRREKWKFKIFISLKTLPVETQLLQIHINLFRWNLFEFIFTFEPWITTVFSWCPLMNITAIFVRAILLTQKITTISSQAERCLNLSSIDWHSIQGQNCQCRFSRVAECNMTSPKIFSLFLFFWLETLIDENVLDGSILT